MNTSLRLPVTDTSLAGEARRTAALWMKDRGFSAELSGSVALVVTELAKNLALHSAGGVLLLRNISRHEENGVEILSLDQGPGVANFGECLRDGFSTAGTSGIGLGAVQRASRVFDVHSQPGVGTALLSEIWERPSYARRDFECGGASVAFHGEPVCGDQWAAQDIPKERVRLLVADGLGHGHFAAEAAKKAVEIFEASPKEALLPLIENMHVALRSTRGAALAIAEIDIPQQTVTYLGVGNISATIVHPEKRVSLVSLNGTLGVQYRSLQQFSYPWSRGAFLVMHSDGLKTSWNFDRYTGLAGKHPSIVAGILYRDFHRTTDDSTAVVLRLRP